MVHSSSRGVRKKDRSAADFVTKASQNVPNSVVAPTRVFDGQGDNEGGKLGRRVRAAMAAPRRAIVRLRNQLPIPAQDRVKVHNASKLPKAPKADSLARSGETTALRVCEAHPIFA